MSSAESGLRASRRVRFAARCVLVALPLSCARSSSRAAPKPNTSSVVVPAPRAGASTSAPAAQGLAPTAVSDAQGRVGLIDSQGHVIAAPQFEEVRRASEGLMPAREHGLWGFVDLHGAWAIPAAFSAVSSFSEDRAAASLPGAPALGYLDHSGQFVIPPSFRSADAFHEGLAHVALDRTSAYVDKAGAVAFDVPGEWSYDFHEGLARFVSRERQGFVDAKGHVVIPARFDSASDFFEGLAAVKVGALWGFVDKTGRYRIRPKFVDASFFSGGIAKVALTQARLGFVDQRGKLLGSFTANSDYSNGYAAVLKGDLWGFIDATGALIAPPKFEKFEGGFSEGLAAVAEPNRPFGYIGTDGHYVIEPQFELASAFENGLARIQQRGRNLGAAEVGLIDHSGRLVWGPSASAP